MHRKCGRADKVGNLVRQNKGMLDHYIKPIQHLKGKYFCIFITTKTKMEEKAHCVQMQYHQYSVRLIAFGGGVGG